LIQRAALRTCRRLVAGLFADCAATRPISDVALGISVSARAQWIVYDPTFHTQSILLRIEE
jgi:hypothetical protein